MKLNILIATVVAMGLSACSTPDMNNYLSKSNEVKEKKNITTYWNASEVKQDQYKKRMRQVASRIKFDEKYNKMDLNDEDSKKWFRNLTYFYWDRQITKEEFISMGLERYPEHKYELDFIVNGMDAK